AVADRAEGRGHPLLGGLHPGVGDGERVLGRGGAAAVGGGTLVGGAGLLRIGALPGVGGTGRERQQERGEGGPPRYAGDGPCAGRGAAGGSCAGGAGGGSWRGGAGHA